MTKRTMGAALQALGSMQPAPARDAPAPPDSPIIVFEGVTLAVEANNLFDIRPNRVNEAGMRVAPLAGDPAVEIYPKFSAFGVNGVIIARG